MPAVIETQKLTKVYESSFRSQDVRALQDLDLTIDSGEIFGYLGPNGSGKTTTIKLLLGLIFPTSGTMRILGSDDIGAAAVKRRIGYLPEGAYYPDFLRGEEVLRFYGHLYGLGGSDLTRRIDKTIETVGMTGARKRMIRGYSKGMRQRIGLAQALLSDPDLLILDEPTTGLDPIARKEIRDILSNLRDQGKTLLISSHELLEVELISNRVGILYNGVLQTIGTVDELLTQRDVLIHITDPTGGLIAKLNTAGLHVEDATATKMVVRVPENLSVYDALEICRAEKATIQSIAPRRETLEELFVRVVGAAENKTLA
ncbi:MAG: ABC transporter ATP-binding protein [Candidatus Hydrogenedentes bacterium]|nr:ABC transporter ATP-binding protein [Candidatus Hydrogenedentota bacterium]